MLFQLFNSIGNALASSGASYYGDKNKYNVEDNSFALMMFICVLLICVLTIGCKFWWSMMRSTTRSLQDQVDDKAMDLESPA